MAGCIRLDAHCTEVVQDVLHYNCKPFPFVHEDFIPVCARGVTGSGVNRLPFPATNWLISPPRFEAAS